MSGKSRQTLPVIVDGFLYKYRIYIFALLCGYFIAAHYWVLGYTTWDGLSYRIPPVIELIQHGDLGGWKFDYPAAQHFYPFFELVHIPFLVVFGLPGLYFSFSLVLLPLSIAAIYLFVRELTGNSSWALYAALVYLAIPFVNTQPFSGYIDFAVIGALAFFLYAFLRMIRSEKISFISISVLSLATFIFSMSRQQSPYLALLITVVLAGWYLGPWNKSVAVKKLRWVRLHRLSALLIAFAIGMVPSAWLHVGRYLRFGSPIYPYQFDIFGITTPVGLTRAYIDGGAGLIAPGWQGMLVSFRRGWIWPGEWPDNFFDSRVMGVGLFFWIMWITLPVLDRVLDRNTTFLLVLFAILAIAAQDFWLPRWSMTLVLALVVCVGGALSRLASNGPSGAFVLLLMAVLIHLGRPVYDAYSMIRMHKDYIRINISGSPWFIENEAAPGEVELYPDLNIDLLLVHPLENAFSLPLYGRQLSNRIVGVLDPGDIDASCNVVDNVSSGRQTLIVDHFGKLEQSSDQCSWVCEASSPWRCLAGKLIRAE